VCDEAQPERNGAGLFLYWARYLFNDVVQFSKLENVRVLVGRRELFAPFLWDSGEFVEIRSQICLKPF
jgi:hypothetical protein